MDSNVAALIFMAMLMGFVIIFFWLPFHEVNKNDCRNCRINCNNCEYRRRK